MELLIIVLLLLLNGVFAMGEISLVSSRRTRLEDRAKRGNPGAKAALVLLEHPDRLLSTVQIGITVIGVIAGAFGGVAIAGKLAHILAHWDFIAPYADSISLLIVVSSITFVSIIVGELIPKTIALNNPEPVAMVVAPIIVAIASITLPLVKTLTFVTQGVLRILGIQEQRPAPVSEEEFKLLIEEGVQHGVIEHQESQMLKGIFRFDDRKAQSIMTHRQYIEWINIQDPAKKIHDKILEADVTKFLVCDGALDNVIGILSIKDYFRLESRQGNTIRAILTPPLFIPENMTGLKILEKFREHKHYMGVVLNEHGTVEGVVTLHDLIERIIGALPDEDDDDAAEFVQREDGSWLVDGAALLDEMKDHMGLDAFDHDERAYSTVGGLMMDYLKKVPSAGDYFDAWGHRFEVVDMDGNRVDKVLISKREAEKLLNERIAE
ncbi:HlyC/CorC family transporter [bacterium]|nr:HlyC/CorC family transporter [bacterium]